MGQVDLQVRVLWLPRPQEAQKRIDELVADGYEVVSQDALCVRLRRSVMEYAPLDEEVTPAVEVVATGVITLVIAVAVALFCVALVVFG